MNYAMLKSVLFALVLISPMVACSPQPTMFKAPEGGNPLYQKAWKEGCESGFAVYGNDYWRAHYSYNADVKLITSNKLYSRVWWDSFNYCRHYVNRYLNDGFWGSEGFGSGSAANFNQDLRNTKVIEQEGFMPPYWKGIELHGWGDSEKDVTDFGYLGGPKYNWLGQQVKE